jgi:signal transduction histidine kinase/ActR/RegA family two-component response regulator
MFTWLALGRFARLRIERRSPSRDRWQALPPAARLYVAGVITLGAVALIGLFPNAGVDPLMLGALVVCASLTSVWKVNLPIAVTNGSTLSVSCAANVISLLLLGPRYALVVAAVGAWAQCTYKAKHSDPKYRVVFSTAAAVITMAVTGAVYGWLGGVSSPVELAALSKPLVGAVTTYFLVNTWLVAGAIALSTRRGLVAIWRRDFVWSGSSFMVSGGAGALAAVVVGRGDHWSAILLLAPVYLTYRTYCVFVARLEAEKRHTREARAAERALAEEKKRLDQFLAVVSHELRTPLNAILGWADMLRRGKLSESQRDRASRTIFSSARHQAEMIEDLLDVARIASGKLRLDRTLIDLGDVVRNAQEVVQAGADLKGIRVVAELGRTVSLVNGDRARLEQIASNLLSNAIKFTPSGGLVHVRLHDVGTMVELTVADTGQGISEEFLPWVFEAFRQADGSTTRVHGGLGLGLSIVKNLVDAHGGTVTAQSPGEGRGATFTVRLPIAARARRGVLGDAALGATTERLPSLAGVSVLVVDDDETSREMVATHLQSSRAEVVTAASASEAFDLLHGRSVDVLVADIGMPGEDGYSFIQRVRTSGSPEVASIPAAALTAFASDEDRAQALRAGFQMHLAKPIETSSLVTAVAGLHKLRAA